MKKYLLSMFALAALTACTKAEDQPTITPDDALVPITLSAGIDTMTETKAPISGEKFGAGSDVFRVLAYQAPKPTAPDWSATPYFSGITVNSDAAGDLTFAQKQHYPSNGDNIYFYAWTTPGASEVTAGTSTEAPKVTYTITGDEDIMSAQAIEEGYNKDQSKQPAFAFTHKLMQVAFAVKSDASFESGKTNVTKIEILAVNTTMDMNLITGELSNYSTPLALSAYDDGTGVAITDASTTIPGSIMFEPVKTFNIKVTTTGGDAFVYNSIGVTLSDAGVAGNSYLVTLTFKRTDIVPTASITDWISGGTGSGDVQ